MSRLTFAQIELTSALSRGVRQLVLIGSRPFLRAILLSVSVPDSGELPMEVFAVAEEQPLDLPGTFVPTRFSSESLGGALDRSGFDKVKSTLVMWLDEGGFRTFDTAITSLAFIASLPEGSGVVLNYRAESSGTDSPAHTPLDVLSSRIVKRGVITNVIQPEALRALLRGLGFQRITELVPAETPMSGEHLVSALVGARAVRSAVS